MPEGIKKKTWKKFGETSRDTLGGSPRKVYWGTLMKILTQLLW